MLKEEGVKDQEKELNIYIYIYIYQSSEGFSNDLSFMNLDP